MTSQTRPLTHEPFIKINGRQLSEAEAMTMRVALESFAISLAEDGLGEDSHGKTMVRLYLKNIESIRRVMFTPPTEGEKP